MKDLKFNTLFAGLVLCGLLALQSFGTDKGEIFAPTTKMYTHTFTRDSITDTENDTLLLPASDVQSLYTYAWYITRTNRTGTTVVSATLQESPVRTGGTSDWVTIGTSAATTATNERLSGTDFLGRRQRLIVDGVSGTQLTEYYVTAVLKLK